MTTLPLGTCVVCVLRHKKPPNFFKFGGAIKKFTFTNNINYRTFYH